MVDWLLSRDQKRIEIMILAIRFMMVRFDGCSG